MMRSQDDARLDAALGELGAVETDLPAGFRSTVMDAVRRQQVDRGQQLASVTHGGTMTKKAMFGLAAAAAVAFVVLWVTGFPPTLDNIQATVGQAKRYAAPQMTDGDAPIGDPAVQQFLQSETFAALIADRDVARLLANAEVRQALSNDDLVRALRSPNFADAVSDAAIRSHLEDAALRGALDQALRSHLEDASLRHALENAEVRSHLARALRVPGFAEALRSNSLRSALKASDFARAIGSADLARALAKANIRH